MCDEKWVWPENFRDVNIYADFVHKFTVGGSFSKAQLIIRADSQYVLWINGKFAGYGQYPDYPFYTVYDSIDITSYIKSGENRMCILGYCQAEESSTYYPGTPGIRFRVECDGEVIAKSGADTLCRQDPCYKSGSVPKISGQLSFGFICNGCNYDGWLTADTDGFDTPECRENSSEPVLRKIKKTVLLDNKPSRLIASGTVKADLSDCETGRRMQQAEWDPENPNGIYMLFDLSEESSGLLTLKTNLKSGAKIDIGFGEAYRRRKGKKLYLAQKFCSRVHGAGRRYRIYALHQTNRRKIYSGIYLLRQGKHTVIRSYCQGSIISC